VTLLVSNLCQPLGPGSLGRGPAVRVLLLDK